MSKIFYKVYTPNYEKSQNDLTSYKNDESILLSSFDRDGKSIVQEILNNSTQEKEIRGLYFHPDLKIMGLIRVPKNGSIDNYKDYLKLFNLNINNEIQNILKEPNNIISNEITRIISENPSTGTQDLSTKANIDASNINTSDYKDVLGIQVYSFENDLNFDSQQNTLMVKGKPYIPGNNLIIAENLDENKFLTYFQSFKTPIKDLIYNKADNTFYRFNGFKLLKITTSETLQNYATLQDLQQLRAELTQKTNQVLNFKGVTENIESIPSDSKKGDAYINRANGTFAVVSKEPFLASSRETFAETPLGNVYNYNTNTDLSEYLEKNEFNNFSSSVNSDINNLKNDVQNLKLNKVDLTDYVKKSEIPNLVQNVTFNNDYIKVINNQGELEPARIVYGEFDENNISAITLRIKQELQNDISKGINTFIFIDLISNKSHIMKKDNLQFV